MAIFDDSLLTRSYIYFYNNEYNNIILLSLYTHADNFYLYTYNNRETYNGLFFLFLLSLSSRSIDSRIITVRAELRCITIIIIIIHWLARDIYDVFVTYLCITKTAPPTRGEVFTYKWPVVRKFLYKTVTTERWWSLIVRRYRSVFFFFHFLLLIPPPLLSRILFLHAPNVFFLLYYDIRHRRAYCVRTM